MGVTEYFPLICFCTKELVHGKKNFLSIRALGDQELLLNSLKPIFGFHWVLGLGECGRASSQEFPKPGLRWWWWWLLLVNLLVWLQMIERLKHSLHQLILRGD